MKRFYGFSSFQLHLFAMLFMLIDHVGYCFFPYCYVLRYIGRLSFPFFCFLLVNGFFYTKNKCKYFLRLLLFTVLSEIPFDLAFSNVFIELDTQNVLLTFLISFLMLLFLEKAKKKYFMFYPLIIFIFTAIAFILKTDYKGFGVLIVLIFYLTHNLDKKYRFIIQFIGLFIINFILFKGFCVSFGCFLLYSQPFALFSLFFIWGYNGNKGYSNGFIKYFNYIFYPIHLILLYLLRICI